MINLMKADIYRIFKGIGIYIAFALVIIMSSVSITGKEPGYIGNAYVSYDEHEEDSIVMTSGSLPEQSPDTSVEPKMLVRSILAANINLYYPLILVVFAILMSDFSNKTLKNTLTSAVSKRKYFAYKLLMSLGFSALFIIFGNLFAYILNFFLNGKEYTEPISNIFKATFLQMPLLLGVVSFLIFIGFLTRRTAVYNAISICFVMVFQILLGAVFMLTKAEFIGEYLKKYELQAALGRLAYFPENNYCLICLSIGLGEIIIFGALSYLIFKKSEIK